MIKKTRIPVWECECGSFEYSKYPPEECPKCNASDSFVEIPEDKLEEIEEDIEGDLIGKIRTKDFDELGEEEEDEDY